MKGYFNRSSILSENFAKNSHKNWTKIDIESENIESRSDFELSECRMTVIGNIVCGFARSFSFLFKFIANMDRSKLIKIVSIDTQLIDLWTVVINGKKIKIFMSYRSILWCYEVTFLISYMLNMQNTYIVNNIY